MPTSASIALPSLELVSTLRTSPRNGPPSSQDYNDGEQEKLVDLTTLITFINNTLLPLLNTLNPDAASGLDASNLYGDLSSQETVFFNSQTGQSLSVADGMRLLFGQGQTLDTTIKNLSVQVASLQARLSASNQNDIALALQGFTSNLNAQESQLRAIQLAVSSLQLLAGTSMEAQVGTPVISAGSIETVTVLWSVPFANNTYTVSYGVEDASGFLQVSGFSYLPSGQGILIRVINTDTLGTHAGTVHAIARVSQLTAG